MRRARRRHRAGCRCSLNGRCVGVSACACDVGWAGRAAECSTSRPWPEAAGAGAACRPGEVPCTRRGRRPVAHVGLGDGRRLRPRRVAANSRIVRAVAAGRPAYVAEEVVPSSPTTPPPSAAAAAGSSRRRDEPPAAVQLHDVSRVVRRRRASAACSAKLANRTTCDPARARWPCHEPGAPRGGPWARPPHPALARPRRGRLRRRARDLGAGSAVVLWRERGAIRGLDTPARGRGALADPRATARSAARSSRGCRWRGSRTVRVPRPARPLPRAPALDARRVLGARRPAGAARAARTHSARTGSRGRSRAARARRGVRRARRLRRWWPGPRSSRGASGRTSSSRARTPPAAGLGCRAVRRAGRAPHRRRSRPRTGRRAPPAARESPPATQAPRTLPVGATPEPSLHY